jgi:hypothetical protein
VANSEEVWCTSIDWAALTIDVVRPVVMAHGILSSGVVWNDVWLAQLQSLGILYGTPGNHGNLDSIVKNAAKIGNEVAAAKSRFGVDKVVLVATAGGLDSRSTRRTTRTSSRSSSSARRTVAVRWRMPCRRGRLSAWGCPPPSSSTRWPARPACS